MVSNGGLTVQAMNTQAIYQGYPGLLDMHWAHVGVGEVKEPSGALMYENKNEYFLLSDLELHKEVKEDKET